MIFNIIFFTYFIGYWLSYLLFKITLGKEDTSNYPTLNIIKPGALPYIWALTSWYGVVVICRELIRLKYSIWVMERKVKKMLKKYSENIK